MTRIAVIYYSSTGNIYQVAGGGGWAPSGGVATRPRRVRDKRRG